jgi:hypothetical protein
MAFEKSLYWVTVALMAVFLGNHFANKSSYLADRAAAKVQRLSIDASHFGATAQAMFEGNGRFAGPELTMARVQSHFASVQAALARRQASCARAQAHHASMMALEQMENVRVLCPRQRMEIPNNPDGPL